MGKHKIAFGINLKKLFGSALLLFATMSVSAQTVQTFFVDNIDLPYLTTAQKQQLVDDFKDKKGDALVVNSPRRHYIAGEFDCEFHTTEVQQCPYYPDKVLASSVGQRQRLLRCEHIQGSCGRKHDRVLYQR